MNGPANLPQPGMAARDLVPGDPDEVERIAGQFARFARGATDAAGKLSGLDSEHWSGEAAERFRDAARAVPDAMRSGATAFEAASTALRAYAQVLRDGQRTAARAVGLVEDAARATAHWKQGGSLGPDPGEEQRQQARRLADRAADEVRRAAQAAAQRLGQLSDRAPHGAAVLAGGVVHGDTRITTVVDHQLDRPEEYVAPLDQTTAEVRYGADHEVAFAGGGGDDWQSWQSAGEGREVGAISTDTVAGAALLLVGAARRRRRTALQAAGLEAGELRDRQRVGRRGDGTATQTAGGWRTNLAGRPRTGPGIRAWAGTAGNPLRRGLPATGVPLAPPGEAPTGVVQHTGPPPRS